MEEVWLFFLLGAPKFKCRPCDGFHDYTFCTDAADAWELTFLPSHKLYRDNCNFHSIIIIIDFFFSYFSSIPSPSFFSSSSSSLFLCPLSLTLASLTADAHSGNFLGLLSIIILSGWWCQPCAEPHSGGPCFNFRLCSPVEVSKRLRDPPCLIIVGHSLSGYSTETCLAGMTLPVAILLSA